MIAVPVLLAAALAQAAPARAPAQLTLPQPTGMTCGAVSAPGLAELGSDGVWRGYLVALCRRLASATGRDPTLVTFRGYDDSAALSSASMDDIAFLSPRELATGSLRSKLLAGPVVSHDRQLLIQRADAPPVPLPSLAGKLVCFIAGTRAESALNRWARQAHVAIEFLPFQEPVEMEDAFAVGKCAAEAIDIANIASPKSVRVLTTLESLPILVTTPIARGAEWRERIVAALTGGGAKGAGPQDR